MSDKNDTKRKDEDGNDLNTHSFVRTSISLRLIRHAESSNNEVYTNARYIYRGGTPEFDLAGWTKYVDTHREADPGLSKRGYNQADVLSDFFVPHLLNQASHPVRIIVSPMRRTLETIKPTLEKLQRTRGQEEGIQEGDKPKVHIIVNGFYFESEGCHIKETPEEGMNPTEIFELLKDCVSSPHDIEFVGFPEADRGWYVHGKGAETRAESEARAATFYLWLCEHLDKQLAQQDHDLFDAGVQMEGEEHECEHDKHGPRKRLRRTTLLIGHGDFMSLVIKRIVAGYGHHVETEGIPHRSAFVHFNTGISEFEYFGQGRFLVMGINQTPHFQPHQYSELKSGGSLKDGWSFLMPADKFLLNSEVTVAFSDEDLEEHVREQTQALKALYLSSTKSQSLTASNALEVEQEETATSSPSSKDSNRGKLTFVVKRGLQVVGVATYSETTGQLTDVAIRPSAADDNIGETLMNAVKTHACKLGRSGSLVVFPRSDDSKDFFEGMGFSEIEVDKEKTYPKMETKLHQ